MRRQTIIENGLLIDITSSVLASLFLYLLGGLRLDTKVEFGGADISRHLLV